MERSVRSVKAPARENWVALHGTPEEVQQAEARRHATLSYITDPSVRRSLVIRNDAKWWLRHQHFGNICFSLLPPRK